MKLHSHLFKGTAIWLTCAFVLASCSLGGSGSSGGASVWLDQPVSSSLLPLAVFTLKAHASPGSSGGVTRIQFMVNDVPVGSVDTDASQPIVYAETSWNPSATGSYTISAQAFAGNSPASSEIAIVCVSDQVSVPTAGFGGDCADPIAGDGAEITDTPAPVVNPITVDATVNDNPVYYGDCSPHVLTVKANLGGDLSAFDAVRVSWLYDTVAGTSPFGLDSIGFDHNEMTVQPDGSYLWSTDLNPYAARWGLTGDPYMIYVYVTAWDSGWSGLGFAGPVAVRWLPCPGSATFTPTFTTIPAVITPTFTPVPADTTPPGITITQINPADTAYYISGCGPNTITVTAGVTDTSAITNVSLTYQYSNGASAALPMTSLGGGNYQATVSMDINTYNALLGVNGTVSFRVNASDSHGNTANASGGPVTLMYCSP